MNNENIIKQVLDGKKIMMFRDPIPEGSVGVSIVWGDGKEFHGIVDIKQHAKLLLAIAEVVEQQI
tara:strand:+ start:484 stop:678 length:195 start_codon:yes stop_codon:yes gene_type:complete